MAFLSISPVLLIHMPSGDQWIILLVIVVLLFGGKKIPELAKGIGKGIREFNDAKEGVKKEEAAEIEKKFAAAGAKVVIK